MSLKCLILSVIAVSAITSPLTAAEKPLKISIRREWDGARSSAPLSLRGFVKWQQQELLEGRLQVHAFADENQVSRWTSSDTALSASEQVIWFMTPRPVLINQLDRYVLEAEFQGVSRSFDPEQLDVEVPVRGRRIMVVAVVLDHGVPTPTGLATEGVPNAYEQPLLLQQFLSEQEGPDLRLHLSRVKPLDLPSNAFRLLGLDALLISHDMLSQLRPTQLEAVRTWVLAGGSLTLVQLGSLRGAAEEFVRSLSRDEWSPALASLRGLSEGTTGFSPGVGQLIRVSRELRGDSAEWKRVARLTLRLQPEKIAMLEQNSTLQLRPTLMDKTALTRPFVLEPRPRFDLQDLTNQLKPDSIQGMPFGLAASVLAGCLFCIAPGDYLLLGLLKRRKWTWGLFPLVALGFTGWMAYLAAEHNGRNDSRSWISVVDVTPENEIVRTSRLELTYGASGRTVAHTVQNQWWTDLRQEDFPSSVREIDNAYSPWDTGNADQQQSAQALGERLAYRGNVPGHYVVEEPIRQWAPRLQRITTLGADPSLQHYQLPQIDWKAISVDEIQTMIPTLQRSVCPDWPDALWMIRGPGLETRWQRLNPAGVEDKRSSGVLQIVANVCGSSQPQGADIFSLLTELSPTAAPDCEDLVLTSRPMVLIANEVEPGRFLVLRVVFPIDSTIGQDRAVR